MMSVLALSLAMGSAVADDAETPEAVQMFELLIKRIPPGIDAHDIHPYIGKRFNYVFNGGSSANHGVQWAPFWVANRLYCIHRPQTPDGTVAVYQIIEPDLKSKPFTTKGLAAYDECRKFMDKRRGAFRVLDLYAVIDHGAKLKPDQLRYKLIYSSKPSATPNP